MLWALAMCHDAAKESLRPFVSAWGVSKEKYHQLDETQLLYTIASRAMYKLDLIYTGEKSPLFDNLDEKTSVNK